MQEPDSQSNLPSAFRQEQAEGRQGAAPCALPPRRTLSPSLPASSLLRIMGAALPEKVRSGALMEPLWDRKLWGQMRSDMCPVTQDASPH